MPGNLLEAKPRTFNPVSIPGLSNEAREAVNAVLKGMSTWRNEGADISEKNSKQVRLCRRRVYAGRIPPRPRQCRVHCSLPTWIAGPNKRAGRS